MSPRQVIHLVSDYRILPMVLMAIISGARSAANTRDGEKNGLVFEKGKTEWLVTVSLACPI